RLCDRLVEPRSRRRQAQEAGPGDRRARQGAPAVADGGAHRRPRRGLARQGRSRQGGGAVPRGGGPGSALHAGALAPGAGALRAAQMRRDEQGIGRSPLGRGALGSRTKTAYSLQISLVGSLGNTMPPRKDLGAILVEEDVLDQKDLERIARGKDNARRPLWGVIVESDLATPEQIFRALSARFGVPVVSDERLAEVAPPEALKRALSRAEALIAGLFPVDLSADGQRATVVMVDPSDEQTLADFLTRAQVPEGRALLARRDAITRAIERVWGETTAVVTPLPPGRRKPAPSKSSPQVVVPISDDDVTGTVKLDPSLQAELSRLPPRAPSPDDALTPLPQRRPKRPTPQPTAAEPTRQVETPSEALRAEERLTRALIETIEALATELEARVVGGSGAGAEMARLSRRVARQLGLPRRLADEIGVAAQLFALDRQMRQIEGAGSA